MSKPIYESIVTKEMKDCYAGIEIPPASLFRMRDIPIIVLKKIGKLISDYQPNEQLMGGGLFHGSAGVAYTLIRAANLPLFEPIKGHLLSAAKGYADASLEYCDTNELQPVSFMLGKSGVYAVSAVLYKKLGYNYKAIEFVNLFHTQGSNCLLVDYKYDGGEDICDGRAGYILAALWLRNYFRKQFQPQFFYRLLDLMFQACRYYSKQTYTSHQLAYCSYKSQGTGILNGLSGILFTFLCFPSYLDSRPKVNRLLKQSIDQILLHQGPDGNFCPFMDKDDTFDPTWIALNWKYGGSGLGNGLTGQLYAILILYRLTGNKFYLQTAHACTKFLNNELVHEGRRKAVSFSLFSGSGGIIVYLMDMITVQQAEFPFLPVFHSFEE